MDARNPVIMEPCLLRLRLALGCVLLSWCGALLGCSGLGVTYQNHPVRRLPDGSPARNATLATTACASASRDRGADGTFFGIAVSGGGMRAAHFAAATLGALERFRDDPEAGAATVDVMRSVDFLSSNSGGSITAAHYCLTDPAVRWDREHALNTLGEGFGRAIIGRVFLGAAWFGAGLSDWDYTDEMAQIYDRRLYRGARFADLRADRPGLLINATQYISGEPFVFRNADFDRIGSDLSRYPVAWAVAASAAFPAGLTPVTLHDYTRPNAPYVHVYDGASVDNLAMLTLLRHYRACRSERNWRRCILIQIDAATWQPAESAQRAEPRQLLLLEAAVAATDVLLRENRRYVLREAARLAQPTALPDAFDEAFDAFLRTGWLSGRDDTGAEVLIWHIALRRLLEASPEVRRQFSNPALDQQVNAIATWLGITRESAVSLHDAAEVLVQSAATAEDQAGRQQLLRMLETEG